MLTKSEHSIRQNQSIVNSSNKSSSSSCKVEDNFQFLKQISKDKDRGNSYFEENRIEIQKYFTKLIPDYKKDLLIIISRLAKIVNDECFVKLKDKQFYRMPRREKILEILNDKINRCNKNLILDGENLILIAKILSEAFIDITKEYKLKTFNEFLIRLNTDSNNSKNGFKDLIIEKKEEIKIPNFDSENENCLFNRINRTLFNYTFFPNLLTTKYKIPNELRELSKILQKVKSISFQFSLFEFTEEKVSLPIWVYFLFYMNFNWLFKNLDEVKISYNLIPEEFDNFSSKIFKKIKKGDLLVKSFFLKIITTSIFISKTENFSTLKIDIPYAFQNEIESFLNYEKVSVKNFHILDLFAEIKNLKNFEITFNSLDSNTFKRIMSLTSNNSDFLKSLKLRLFPNNFSNEILFSKKFLYRLCEVNNIDTNEIKEKYTKKTFLSIEYENLLYKEKDFLINQLINNFEMDIEILFFLLSIKLSNLSTFYFSCVIPQVILANDKYNKILHKFLFDNLFNYIGTSFESLQNLSIITNVSLNTRKYQYLTKYFENFNLNKNKKLKKLKIDLKIKKFLKILLTKFIPNKIEFLSIGELDFYSFKEFSEIISDKNNLFLEKLTYLNITVSDVLFDFNKNIEDLIKLIRSQKPKNVEYLNFNLIMPLTQENSTFLIKNIPDDHVKTYRVYFINSPNPKCYMDQIGCKEIISKNAYDNLISLLLYLFSKRLKRRNLSNLKRIFENTHKYLNTSREKKFIIKFDD